MYVPVTTNLNLIPGATHTKGSYTKGSYTKGTWNHCGFFIMVIAMGSGRSASGCRELFSQKPVTSDSH